MTPLGLAFYLTPSTLAGLIPVVTEGSLASELGIKAGDRIIACNGSRDFQQALTKGTTGQVFDLKLKRPKQYSIKVQKLEGLGLKLIHGNDESHLFIDEILPGAIAALNKKYEDREVRVLDSIIEVNGIRDSAKQMMYEIDDSACVQLTIERVHNQAQVLNHQYEAQAKGYTPLSEMVWSLSQSL